MHSSNKEKITIRKIEHRGYIRIGMYFRYNPVFIDKVKNIEGRSFSKSKRCWHLPYNDETINKVIAIFGNQLILDDSIKKPKTCLPKITPEKLDRRSHNEQHLQASWPSANDEPRYESHPWVSTKKLISNKVKQRPNAEIVGKQKSSFTKKTKAALTQASKPKPQPKRKVQSKNISPKWMDKIEDFLKYLHQRRYAESSISCYRKSILQFFGWYCSKGEPAFDLVLINKYSKEQFIDKKQSRSAQNMWVSALKLFLQKYEDINLDSSLIERPRISKYLPSVLSISEVQRLILSYKNIKHRTIIMTIYACGLRRSELINLKIRDLDKERKVIRIRYSKGAKDRDVPLPDNLLHMIEKYLDIYKPKIYLFNGQGGEKYSPSSINKLIKRGMTITKINKHITAHSLRHSYATHLVEKNINLRYIQEALGHRSSKTTEIYTKLSRDEVAKSVSPVDFWDDDISEKL